MPGRPTVNLSPVPCLFSPMMVLVLRKNRSDTGAGSPVTLERFQKGRADAEYALLFRDEFPAVVRTVFLILHDRQGAEDVAQEAFTQLLVHWRKISRYELPEAWVRRVAIRLAVRGLRRERLRSALHREVEPPSVTSPVDVDLVRAVGSLPPQQRAAIALFYFEDQPVSEIARILDCSESTAKVHLFKARQRLAGLLGEDAIDVS
jgi:RNA polymerase sigma factor (sigma-70 family)